MSNDIQQGVDELSSMFGSINVVDRSQENIGRAVTMLNKGFSLLQKCASQDGFDSTKIYLNENDPQLDILAIGQLFTEANAVLENGNRAPGRKQVLEALNKRIVALSDRLKGAGDVYAQASQLASKDISAAVIPAAIREGLCSPDGTRLLVVQDEFSKKLTESMGPMVQTSQQIGNIAIMMQAALITLSTAVVPLQMTSTSQLEQFSSAAAENQI